MALSHNDYMIAWICALPLEMAAAKVMLDETHPPLCQPKSDSNAYTLGSISGHNIVVACLPSGVYGITSAAVVLANMLPTFPSLRFGLMVGIGGGVPSKTNDIRLGDVVVSMPTTNSGGVVQYDFGKAIHDGKFQHTGSLNRPSQTLLTAVSQMRSNEMIGKRLTAQILSDELRKHEDKRKSFSRPDKDWLFSSDYQHYGDLPNCSMCDPSQLVDREMRLNEEPVIHYGLIASGNQVMKDAKKRVSLAQSMDILCFEMEAAGLVDQLPCLVIRGICDYCDSHKHKEWQGYAALAAAAYAKELLSVAPLAAMQSVSTTEFLVPLDLATVPAIEEFIGRQEDLEHLWHYLQPAGSPSRKIAILHGLGGIGKTQLAIKFAREHKHDFTAIFWLSGKDQSTLVRSLSSCLPRIQTNTVDNEAATEEDAEQRASQVLKWLAVPENRNWLLIFDNVDQYSPSLSHDDGGFDIMRFFPNADHGAILVTSRLQRLAEIGKAFHVKELTTEDAGQLLLQSCGFSSSFIINAESLQDFSRLMDRFHGLPLAIVIAGSFMRETGTGIKEYLEDYQNSWSDLQAQSAPTRHYQQGNILQTWAVSYHEIQKRDPTAAALLLLLSCFDNQDLWYDLIVCGHRCEIIPDWFEAAVGNSLSFKARIKSLLAFSLIESKPQERSYRLHPVVQDWCIHIATTENHIAQLRKLALVSVGYMVPNSDERDYARLQQRLLPHANYLFQNQITYAANDTAVCRAFHRLGNLYSDQGKLKKAEEMYQHALVGKERALGLDHTSTLNTVNNLGNLYSSQGKLEEAEGMYQRALVGKEQALGPDHISTLSVINNLGLLYSHQGKLKEAEEMYQRALVGMEQALGSDHTSTLNTVHNLGNLYWHQSKLKKAEEMYQRALVGREQALGPAHTSVLDIINDLGLLYSAQGKLEKAEEGKLEKAEEMYKRALVGCEQALGSNHTSTLDTVYNLGLLYSDQGKVAKAEEMYQRALVGYGQTLGPNHSKTRKVSSNLGALLRFNVKGNSLEPQAFEDSTVQAVGNNSKSTTNKSQKLDTFYKAFRRK